MNKANFNCGRKLKAAFAFLGIFLLLQVQMVQAQSAGKTTTGQAAQPGTYQLIFNSRAEDKDVKLTQQELQVIEKLRKDNEVVYAAATYSDDIRVKILPRKVISAGDFKPAPLKYFKMDENYEEYSQIRYIPLQ